MKNYILNKKNSQQTLIIQAKVPMKEEDIKKEEARIRKITGMKVCIINARYEVVGVDINNG
ncbi:hypothetical protein [Clostridium sp. D53t1_180928_C8]|uniref:hypothetical protein n=1 Tax=Clostridium sp. D53t1_180928_C8 TaxID=2787101 RepID=UPI0018A9D229|nr:hypothetical protein [Clostridium sp. D53t1_180928_C8]